MNHYGTIKAHSNLNSNHLIPISEFQTIGPQESEETGSYQACYAKNKATYLLKEGDPKIFSLVQDKNTLFKHYLAIEYITLSIFREVFTKKYAPKMLLVYQKNVRSDSTNWHLASKWENDAIPITKIHDLKKPLKGLLKILTLCELLNIRNFNLEHILIKPHRDHYQAMIVGSAADFTNAFCTVNDLFHRLISQREELPASIKLYYACKKNKILKTVNKLAFISPEFVSCILQEVKELMHPEALKETFNKIHLLQLHARYVFATSRFAGRGIHVVQKSFFRKLNPCFSLPMHRELAFIDQLFDKVNDEKIIYKYFDLFQESFQKISSIEALENSAPCLFSAWLHGSFNAHSFPKTFLAIRCGIYVLKFFLDHNISSNLSEYEHQFLLYLKSEERKKSLYSQEDLCLLLDSLEGFPNFSHFEFVCKELLLSLQPKLKQLPFLSIFLKDHQQCKEITFLIKLFALTEDLTILVSIDRLLEELMGKYLHFENFDTLVIILKKVNDTPEVFLQLLTLLSILSSLDPDKLCFQFCFSFLCPLLKYYGPLFLHSPNLSNVKQILINLLKILKTNLNVLAHSYDQSYNKNIVHTVSAWRLLNEYGILKSLLWQPGLTIEGLRENVEKLGLLIQLIDQEETKKMHTRANTLKALCFFIPNANPEFSLTNPHTFDLVLSLLTKHLDEPGLRVALLFLDIFTPLETARLYKFYLQNRTFSFDDIQVLPSETLPTITLSEFKKLDTEEQVEWLYFLSSMRVRDTQIAFWVLHHRHEHVALCSEAMNWLSIIHQTLPKNERQILKKLTAEHPSLLIRQTALHCLKTTLHQKEDFLLKTHLVKTVTDCLAKSLDMHDQKQVSMLLKSLSKCTFDESEDKILLDDFVQILASSQIQCYPEITHDLVCCGMRLIANGTAITRKSLFEGHAFDLILHQLKKIVEGTSWEAFDHLHGLDNTHINHDACEVPHLKFPIKSPFEFNRRKMLLGILDLWVELHQNILLQTLNHFNTPYLDILPLDSYYIPFVDFPDDWKFYRGIGSKHGTLTCQRATIDLLIRGCRPRDLKTGKHDEGNWSKRKEEITGTFFTTDPSWATEPLYYDLNNGALIEISAKKINQERLSMNLRVEKEDGIYHVVVFGGVSKQSFSNVFLHYSWKNALDLIIEHPDLKKQTLKYEKTLPNNKIRRKKIKNKVKKILYYISQEFQSPNYKHIFSTFSQVELWELHRSMNQQAFYKKHVRFVNAKTFECQPREYFSSVIHPYTQVRLQKMKSLQTEYQKTFFAPFCLGQDESLCLPHLYFNEQIENLVQLFSQFQKNVMQIPISFAVEDKILELRTFSQKVAHSLDEDVLDHDHLKLFRLTLYFKEVPVTDLVKAFKKTEILRYFGLQERPESIQILKNLLIFYQSCKIGSLEKEIYLGYVYDLLNRANQNIKETEQLLKLLVD